ncbi:MAG: hypothetical protein U0354_19065 [Candidatus Sericytochromatia bacterium]
MNINKNIQNSYSIINKQDTPKTKVKDKPILSGLNNTKNNITQVKLENLDTLIKYRNINKDGNSIKSINIINNKVSLTDIEWAKGIYSKIKNNQKISDIELYKYNDIYNRLDDKSVLKQPKLSSKISNNISSSDNNIDKNQDNQIKQKNSDEYIEIFNNIVENMNNFNNL